MRKLTNYSIVSSPSNETSESPESAAGAEVSDVTWVVSGAAKAKEEIILLFTSFQKFTFPPEETVRVNKTPLSKARVTIFPFSVYCLASRSASLTSVAAVFDFIKLSRTVKSLETALIVIFPGVFEEATTSEE